MGSIHKLLNTEHQNYEIEKIFRDIDSGKISDRGSQAFQRPAYQYTKSEVGGVRR